MSFLFPVNPRKLTIFTPWKAHLLAAILDFLLSVWWDSIPSSFVGLLDSENMAVAVDMQDRLDVRQNRRDVLCCLLVV